MLHARYGTEYRVWHVHGVVLLDIETSRSYPPATDHGARDRLAPTSAGPAGDALTQGVHPHVALLQALSEANAVTGFEHALQRRIEAWMPAACRIERDRIGNLYAHLDGPSAAPHVLVAAHVDEIGFLVTAVTDGGFLRFRALGAWPSGALIGQRVSVQGLAGEVDGIIGTNRRVIGGPGADEAVSIGDLFIDVGAHDRAHARALGIRPGVAVAPRTSFALSADGASAIGKAWDDRVGVALLLVALEAHAARERRSNAVTGVATVQEEVGRRGAAAIGERLRPDVVIVLEGIQTDDLPGAASDEAPSSALGAGPNLVLHDESMIAHPGLLAWCLDVAHAIGVPVQPTPAFGSNDAGVLQLLGGGTPTVVLGVPCRHIHTHAGLFRLADFDTAVTLLTELLGRLDHAALERIVDT